MKRPITTIAVLLFALYMVRCLSVFWAKSPLDFVDLSDEADRQAITDWYQSTATIPRQPWDLKSLMHAMTHPLAPHRFRPCVTPCGLGGRDSPMLSFCGFVGIFVRTRSGGALKFH